MSSTSVSVVMQWLVSISDALRVNVLQPLWKHSQPCSQKAILSMLEVLVTIAAAKGPPGTGTVRGTPTPLPMPRPMVGRLRSLLQPGPAKYKAATEAMDWACVMENSPAVAVVFRTALKNGDMISFDWAAVWCSLVVQ